MYSRKLGAIPTTAARAANARSAAITGAGSAGAASAGAARVTAAARARVSFSTVGAPGLPMGLEQVAGAKPVPTFPQPALDRRDDLLRSRDRALCPSPGPARGRRARAAEAESRERSDRRRWG